MSNVKKNGDNTGSKKLAPLMILEILKKYSGSSHNMTYDDIAEKLKMDYDMTMERKAIGRNVNLLRSFLDGSKRGNLGEILEGDNGIYYNHPFDNTELRLLIDSVQGNLYFSPGQVERITGKLSALSNEYFEDEMKKVVVKCDNGRPKKDQVLTNVGLIDKAIKCGNKIKYTYFKLSIKKKTEDQRTYTVSPYRLIFKNSKYYLMAYSESKKSLMYMRIDRMKDIIILDGDAAPIESIPNYDKKMVSPDYLLRQPFLYPDIPERISLLCDDWMIDFIRDEFGYDTDVHKVGDDKIAFSLVASPQSMIWWATQYLGSVKITSPTYLKDEMLRIISDAQKTYSTSQITY